MIKLHVLGPRETISDLACIFSVCLVVGSTDPACACSLCRRQVSRLLSSSAGRSSAPGIENDGVWRFRS